MLVGEHNFFINLLQSMEEQANFCIKQTLICQCCAILSYENAADYEEWYSWDQRIGGAATENLQHNIEHSSPLTMLSYICVQFN